MADEAGTDIPRDAGSRHPVRSDELTVATVVLGKSAWWRHTFDVEVREEEVASGVSFGLRMRIWEPSLTSPTGAVGGGSAREHRPSSEILRFVVPFDVLTSSHTLRFSSDE